MTDCLRGQELGVECMLRPGPSGLCDVHDPARQQARREIASRAAKRSHAARLRPLKLGPEFDTPDLSTPERRTRLRALVVAARHRGDLDDKAAGTFLAAIEGAMRDDRVARGLRTKKHEALHGTPPTLGYRIARNGEAPADAEATA